MPDAVAICDLVNYHAERGRMLHRSLESLYDTLRNFLVVEEAGRVIGCVAVEIAWADLAEVKSLAVHPERRGQGIGKALVRRAMQDARELGIRRLFALTYEQAFFERCGFGLISREQLPSKVWSECIYCPKRHACDEIAMLVELEPAEAPAVPAGRPAGDDEQR